MPNTTVMMTKNVLERFIQIIKLKHLQCLGFFLIYELEFESYRTKLRMHPLKCASIAQRTKNSSVLFCSLGLTRKAQVWLFSFGSQISVSRDFQLLQSCLTLCHPLGCSPPGSSVHGILQARFSSVQLLSRVWLFATPWIAARQASLANTNSLSLLKLMSIELVMPSNHLILCRPLLLPPSIFPIIRVFSNESALCTRWPKYWSFGFNISPSNEHPGLTPFRMDWLDLLAVQGTHKSLLQHHSSKASVLRCSAFLYSNSHIHSWLLQKP